MNILEEAEKRCADCGNLIAGHAHNLKVDGSGEVIHNCCECFERGVAQSWHDMVDVYEERIARLQAERDTAKEWVE